MAFEHFLLGSHNYMGTALGSCAKVALREGGGLCTPSLLNPDPIGNHP